METKTRQALIVICIGINLLLILLLVKSCEKSEIPNIKDTTKSRIIRQIDTLKVESTKYRDRWHQGVTIHDTIIKEVIVNAPDNCQPYIAKVDSLRKVDNKNCELALKSDSLLIKAQDSLGKVNEILIGKYKANIVTLCDSIDKHRCKRFKAFTKGMLVGFGISEGLRLINR